MTADERRDLIVTLERADALLLQLEPLQSTGAAEHTATVCREVRARLIHHADRLRSAESGRPDGSGSG